MKPFPALTLCLVTACAPAVSPSGIISPISTPTVTTSLPKASAARGALLAQANCSSCHALGPTGASPFPTAPPLREISRHYRVEQLGEAFAEGFVSTHSAMPAFVLDAGQNRDLLVYLTSIQTE